MLIPWMHQSMRLLGRWNRQNKDAAVTTSIGSTIEISYIGNEAVLCFDLSGNIYPCPHLWISVDRCAMVEVTLEEYIRLHSYGPPDAIHYAKITFKSSVEIQNRWLKPLQAKLGFRGILADFPGILEPDNRMLIEFVGDSITEGVFVDGDIGEESQNTRVFQDDVCGTFAWHTAEKLNMRSRYFGFGGLGVSVDALGGVPKACISYPYIYKQIPMDEESPDLIIVNLGTNDFFKGIDKAVFEVDYISLISKIRAINKKAILVCLEPFIQEYGDSVLTAVEEYNVRYNDKVFFVGTAGWAAREPVHPARKSTESIADCLVHYLKKEVLKGKKII